MDDSSAALIGQSLGNYKLTGSLGFGAMGHVYRAEHAVMGRKAAIKVLNQTLSQNAEAVERFVNEARAVNDIRHPNVVEITDFGQHEGSYYLIMELLEGETLADCITQCGTLSTEEVIRIGSQVASAVEAAHCRNIIHRDLKPENIFLTSLPDYPQFVKVLDFGVAKLLGSRNVSRSRLTQAGMLIGTPHYMSPEQCLGELDVGPSSDIYSLGVVLYEMMSGELPFDDDNLSRLLLAHIHQAPTPLSQRVPNVPTFLNDIIMRSLAKAPEQRPTTMRELRAALLRDPRLEGELNTNPPRGAQNAEGAAVSKAHANKKMSVLRSTALPKRAPDLAARTGINESEDMHDGFGLSTNDAERPQRVGNKLATIIRERVQSHNLVLPTMPQVAVDCVRLLGEERSTFAAIAKLLEQDPLLAAQVLKVANSVAFVSNEKARTLEQAVSRLGARQLRMLLIELSAHQVFQSRDRRTRDAFNGIWEHSLAVALLSRGLSIICGERQDAEAAHLAGLLHDLGKPIVGSMLLEAERSLSAREERFMTPGLWMQVVDDSHRQVGQAIARSWKMPDAVVDALEYCGQYDEDNPKRMRNIVTLANAIAKQAGYCLGTTVLDGNDEIVDQGRTLLGIGDAELDALLVDLSTQIGGHVAA